MKDKRNSLLVEALHMLRIHYKTYIFLSVTIVISLSAFFVFLVYNDSTVYNEYKDVMKTSDKIGMIKFMNDSEIEKTRKAIEQMEGVKSYYYCTQQLPYDKYNNTDIFCDLNITPGSIFAFYHNTTSIVRTKDGDNKIRLKKGEIAISENLYKCIENQKDENGELYVDFDIQLENGEYRTYKFHVVDVLQEMNGSPVVIDGNLIVYSEAIVSEANFEGVQIEADERKMTIYAENPQAVISKLEIMNVSLDMVYTHKQKMIEEFIQAGIMKRTLSIALLFLLGINLYSSFNNALNERKYEIAIRRAIGAKRSSIILQLFFESMIVMVVDILASIYGGFVCIEIYKLYLKYKYQLDWIVYINKYSVEIFICCSVFLSIVFTIIFAVRATLVEVNKYIKGE